MHEWKDLDHTARRWRRVCRLVAARRVAFYWLGAAQRSVCAPGGAGRKRDRDAFEADAAALLPLPR